MSAVTAQRERALEQREAALVSAQEYRLRRCDLKAEVRSGAIKLSEILAWVELPEWLRGEPIDRMLRWSRGLGKKRTAKLLAVHRITSNRAVGDLTYRQRRGLAAALGESEKPPEVPPRSSGRRAEPRHPVRAFRGGQVV